MGALVSVHNDGPDVAHIRIGGRWVQLPAGHSTRVNATCGVEIEPAPQLDPAELALHLGQLPGKPASAACRLANEE